MKNVNTLAVILLIVGLSAGFFTGIKYQESKMPQGVRQFAGGNGTNRGQFGQRNGSNGRPIVGEIISSEDKSITVKLQDGSSKIVLLSDKTQINKAAEGTKSDLRTGERVAVFGSENSDGSVTGQNIQLNPQFRGSMGSPSASPR